VNLEQRITELEAAHRALAARNEALIQICKVILPISLNGQHAMASRLLTSCYDITGEHMDKAKWDDDMQQMVRAAMDEISRAILSGYTQPHRPSSP
jgi:hypothetical protein